MRSSFWISRPTSKAAACCNDQIATKQTPRSLQVVLETLGFHCVISGLVYQGRMWLCVWKSDVGFYTFGGIFLDFVELGERVCEECCLNFSEDF